MLRAALPDEPITSAELFELGHRVLGTDDRWTVAFAYRALPFVRTAPVGEWPHTKPSPFRLWREPLPDSRESAIRVVRQYLAAYGPATRDDIAQFTSFRVRQIAPALEGLPTRLDDQERTLFDVPRAPRAAGGHARAGALSAGVRLDHPRASRPVADRSARVRGGVFNKRNATTKNTFTVDGFVAGAWRIERGRLTIEPFAPLPARVRREVDAEGERLLAWYRA